MSEDGPMNEYLKDNNIEMAAQSATSVLSVLNHAPVRKIKLEEKIKVRLAVSSYYYSFRLGVPSYRNSGFTMFLKK